MATLDEVYAAAKARGLISSDKLAADTASLKRQFAGPDETMGQAVQADQQGLAQGLAGLDFTNPSNMGNVVHQGVPLLMQMLGTYFGGQAGGKAGQVIGSGLGSGAGYLFQSGAEPLAKGQPPTTTPGGLAGNVALGASLEGGAQALGGLGRIAAGKGVALAEGEAAGQAALANRADLATKALGKADTAAEAATGKVQTAQEAVNREVLKHSEDAFQGVKEAEVERMVKEGLGPTIEPAQPLTIDTLKAATAPPQKAARGAVQGVFDGISSKYQQAVEPYVDRPIPQPTLPATIQTLRGDLTEHGGAVSPGLSKLLDEAAGGKPDKSIARDVRGVRAGDIGAASLRLMTPEQRAIFQGQAASEAPTVGQMMGLRSRFAGFIRNATTGTDRRIAASAVDAIQNDINKVLPPEVQPVIQSINDDWHQAKSTFSDAFRNRLWRAETPGQVAEAIYTGAKTGQPMGHRAEILMNQLSKEAPEQVPVLKQSFATMLANSPNVVADIQKMPPRLFKSMFPKTGFDTPKGWVQALEGQSTYKQIAGSPELQAKYQSIYQQGMDSLGTRAKQDALAVAQSQLRAMPNSQELIAGAIKNTISPGQAFEQGVKTGMKRPMLGKGINDYVEHKVLWLGSLAMMGAGHYTNHPGYMAMPLAYLMSSQGLSMALSNPTLGRMYYNALTSKTAEQGMFWLGRLTTAGLTQAARDRKK